MMYCSVYAADFTRTMKDTDPNSPRNINTTKFLPLPSTVSIPSSAITQNILIRECYDDLYQLIFEEQFSILKGDPGIGKSTAIYYFIRRLLDETSIVNIVVHSEDNAFVVYTKRDGKVECSFIIMNLRA